MSLRRAPSASHNMNTTQESASLRVDGEHLVLDLTVSNKMGLHARPATQVVNAVRRGSSAVTATTHGETADASIGMALLLLGAEYGDLITFSARGPDAAEVLSTIRGLFERRFGER